jgi:hypothetical protein
MKEQHVRLITGVAACLALSASLVAAQQKGDKGKPAEARRPKVTLKANPQVVVAPGRVSLTAELTGGADDFEEYYCPTIAWDWGDDTSSESTSDCEPYEAGKSQIKRRYSVTHQFKRPGTYKLYFHMKDKERIVGSASSTVQVQPGLSSGPDPF